MQVTLTLNFFTSKPLQEGITILFRHFCTPVDRASLMRPNQRPYMIFIPNILESTTLRQQTLNWETLQVQRHELSDLDREVTEMEIHAVVMQTPPGKAPGPDGFIGSFYRVLGHNQGGCHCCDQRNFQPKGQLLESS
jgi:hypothetical protein